MKTEEVITKMKRQKQTCCKMCLHPDELGWCEEHCKLPQAYDFVIEMLNDKLKTESIE